MHHRSTERIVSFIDLGTNSARLLIVRLNSNNSYSVLRQQKEMIRLGEGSFIQGILSEEAIGRTIVVCSKYEEISRNFGAEEIYAVATSAARDAVNGQDLISRIKKQAGLDVKVISGEEEARLIYLGVSNGFNLDDELYMFIDIGGGSTEIILGTRFDHIYLKSLKLGALRTYFSFPGDPETGIIDTETKDEISRYVRSRIAYARKSIQKDPVSKVYGSSGTIQSLVSVAEKERNNCNSPAEERWINIFELEKIMTRLCGMSITERKNIPGISAGRADIIAAGAIILFTIMKELGIEKLYSSDRSLRDGLLFDYLSEEPGFISSVKMPVKERSVRQLGKSCRIDECHAEKILEISKELFESAGKLGLHNYGEEELEMLEYAAYLHDVGQFISFSKHQYHSHYVITNAPLLGFNQNELNIIGLIARFHRKKSPKPKDDLFKDLDEETINLVIILSLFLRIAENLDKSHDGRIDSAYFSREADQLILNIESSKDCTIELWAATENLKLLEKTFGMKAGINKK
ncbi:MAG: Ppx/GppA family phosphatase [Methanomicrobiaceae archaeon]|nr:Ppx/GppA family phosphatase [Methanomicrobiaceae archaeon]